MLETAEFITFLFVSDLERSHAFYSESLGLSLALDQGTCRIYRVTNTAFIGVCERPAEVKPGGVIATIVTDDVDALHERLVSTGATVDKTPAHNTEYGIYHAFYRDPDGHQIEVQTFDDPNWAQSRI